MPTTPGEPGHSGRLSTETLCCTEKEVVQHAELINYYYISLPQFGHLKCYCTQYPKKTYYAELSCTSHEVGRSHLGDIVLGQFYQILH